MTAHALPDATTSAPADRRAQLRAALALVEQMAGIAPAADSAPADPRRGQARPADPSAIARRRFDMLASEASAFAAAGIGALIRAREARGRDCAAAAEQLAGDMRAALAAMDRLIPPA